MPKKIETEGETADIETNDDAFDALTKTLDDVPAETSETEPEKPAVVEPEKPKTVRRKASVPAVTVEDAEEPAEFASANEYIAVIEAGGVELPEQTKAEIRLGFNSRARHEKK